MRVGTFLPHMGVAASPETLVRTAQQAAVLALVLIGFVTLTDAPLGDGRAARLRLRMGACGTFT